MPFSETGTNLNQNPENPLNALSTMPKEVLADLIKEWIKQQLTGRQANMARGVAEYRRAGGQVVGVGSKNAPLDVERMIDFLQNPADLQKTNDWMKAGGGIDMEAAECDGFQEWYLNKISKDREQKNAA